MLITASGLPPIATTTLDYGTTTVLSTSTVPTSVYCSCVKSARLLGVEDLPKIPDPSVLKPNSSPVIGAAVLLDYNVPHIAVVTKLLEDGFMILEGNFHKCKKTYRFIAWNDPHLRGFWTSKNLPA